jgi:hypothetical protein
MFLSNQESSLLLIPGRLESLTDVPVPLAFSASVASVFLGQPSAKVERVSRLIQKMIVSRNNIYGAIGIGIFPLIGSICGPNDSARSANITIVASTILLTIVVATANFKQNYSEYRVLMGYNR